MNPDLKDKSVSIDKKKMVRLRIIVAVFISLTIGVGVFAFTRPTGTRTYQARIVNRYPHDRTAYSQGLVFDQGELFEGTGQYGESVLRKVDLKTGKTLQEVRLDRRFFGEGITVWGDRIYQLTWKKGTGFIYDRITMQRIGQFRYSKQGWGITHDENHLILSDGTHTLRFLDPKSYRVAKRLTVQSNGRLVKNLNELEYVNNEIWANIWFKDVIARISPKSGKVIGWINLSNIFPKRHRDREDVLNGIAYDQQTGRIFVTGKNWPTLFEIELTER